MTALKKSFRDLLRYPSAVFGLVIIFVLLGVAVYALVTIPYGEAVRLWRGGEDVWYQNPKYAPPAWFNFFSAKKEPTSFSVNTKEGSMTKTVIPADQNVTTDEITYTFDYNYDYSPQEISLYFNSVYNEKLPFASVALITPDGRKIRVADTALDHKLVLRVSQDQKLQKRLKTDHVMDALFTNPEASDPTKIVKGKYQLDITGTNFEQGGDINVEMVLYGTLYGNAGTDKYRRDLMLPLLYGTPIALAFGLLAALGTSLVTMVIAAIGTWYMGWVDALIQRITEVNLVLPFLAILIMVGTFYSRSLWVMLGVTILLSRSKHTVPFSCNPERRVISKLPVRTVLPVRVLFLLT